MGRSPGLPKHSVRTACETGLQCVCVCVCVCVCGVAWCVWRVLGWGGAVPGAAKTLTVPHSDRTACETGCVRVCVCACSRVRAVAGG